MWIRQSDVIAPLSRLTSKTTTWHWKYVEQKAFDDTMKHIISRETLLAYPNSNKHFIIRTDSIHNQFGADISQDNKPITFYSRKLNPTQTQDTVTECELNSIVKTLKEFRNILHGQQIKVYTDYKKLTYVNFNVERVMRWRHIIEEYSPELIYLKGESNIVADAFSRLELTPSKDETENDQNLHNIYYLADHFGLEDDDLPPNIYPLQYKINAQHQWKQEALVSKVQKDHEGFHIKSFCEGGKKRDLICYNEKIVIQTTLQRHEDAMSSWRNQNRANS